MSGLPDTSDSLFHDGKDISSRSIMTETSSASSATSIDNNTSSHHSQTPTFHPKQEDPFIIKNKMVAEHDSISADIETTDNDNDLDDEFPLDLASISVPPMTLIWENISYTVEISEGLFKRNKTSKTLLTNITGTLKPGEFMCLMGTSGAGKTTFLNVIANRNLTGGTAAGTIYVNNQPRDASFKRFYAYVEQDDLLMPHLTVKETFYFIARLKLPKRYTAEEREAKSTDIINRLGLVGCTNTKIGDALTRGVSGGERKRVVIGTELIMNPRILFLDEPTSGLDSFTAYHVMETVKKITKTSGMSLMATIHQPRTDLFHLFDKLQLLSKGQIVYYGPVSKVLPIFEKAGHACPQMFNPADFILDITTVDTRTPELKEESSTRIEKIVKTYQASEIFDKEVNRVLSEVNAFKYASSSQPSSVPTASSHHHARASKRLNSFEQIMVLSHRNFVNFTRDIYSFLAGIVQAVLMGFICAFAFMKVGTAGQVAIQNRAGCCFFLVVNNSMGGIFNSLLLFHRGKPLFIRERTSGTYNVLPYYIAKTLSEFPFQLLNPIIYIICSYFIIGLVPSAARFFTMLLVLCAGFFTAQGFGLVISALTPNVNVAQGVAPIGIVLFMLYSGFYFNSNNIVKPLIWVYHISFVKYGFSAAMINQFDGVEFSCTTNTPQEACIRNGSQVLNYYNIKGTVWSNIAFLLLLGVVFRVFAYVALYFTTKPQRAKEPKPAAAAQQHD